MTAEPISNWPVLSLVERRILGVLAEKQKTTPDAYPLSVNALVTGCNQKSNRDPVLNLADLDVEDALTACQKKGLVIRLTGTSRVERWRHNMYEAWNVSKAEMAVLCELLLRGPQTEGELRGRVSRMEPLEDVEALRVVLKPMAERRLVVYLTPEGRRGTTLTHGFHAPPDLERLKAAMPVEAPTVPNSSVVPAPPPPPRVETSVLESQLAEAKSEIADLRGRLAEVQKEVALLNEQVRTIKEGLGL